MPTTFRPYQPEQGLLLAPDLRDSWRRTWHFGCWRRGIFRGRAKTNEQGRNISIFWEGLGCVNVIRSFSRARRSGSRVSF